MSPTIPPNPDLDRATVHAAVTAGNIPCLLPVIYQLTGEEKWLSAPYVPAAPKGYEELNSGGLDPAIQAEIHEAATDAILDWSRGKPIAQPAPTGGELARLMSTVMGEPIPETYSPMIAEQLGFTPFEPADIGALIEHDRPDFGVVIVGAGISGLACAIHLDKAGIPYTVFERNDRIGGTWWENTYPGARVDIPSDLYSYSFRPKNWTENFARRDELFGYLEDVARESGVLDKIRLRHSVDNAVWDDQARQWVISVTGPDGERQELRATALVTAAGLHSTPNVPEFPGTDDFRGQIVHAARWPEDIDLTGKRVAVVGSGAAAMQLVVAITDQVQSMVVLQRQPQWIAPNEHYFQPSPQSKHWLYDNIPFYRGWYRFRLYWLYTERTYAALPVDPQREAKGKLVSSLNDAYRAYLTQYLEQQLAGHEQLREQTLPTYPPFGKRLLIDNGWFTTLVKPHVELLTDSVERLTPAGLVTVGGEEREIDVLILCTGFQQQRYLYPMDIRGRDGIALREHWDDDNGRAHLGITTPGFPNLFFLYGPNTNPPGGSFITIGEAQVRYVVEAISRLVTDDLATLECRQDAYDRYNEELDEANSRMVYAMDGVNSYYRNSTGRVVTNSPWPVVEYWTRTQHPDPADFVATPRGAD
ncbi:MULTISPECIES: NAD(P)/FAD-dependent oxidoreductase [Nocardia]|uniref:flavin-containing monooxygenase n=1 Tax=Nocardia TaxID=1817 RepID=UPI0007E9ADB3|nr:MULTISPECIES: NAD(P)/FAD-dependent oxidoreductase [Nocardia]MBF6277874.1 NAD(P)/FAD-dependent oxidoreductase [Nocardia nova]OBA51580.1 FAD-dependent oxidoreductase [Nocardia sp. 852002-51101_SCH5132738]OBB46971.1 FAD-dependent oxidoreductase [Nocardia sp. 852002-51244_SCH5132740]OBF72021.1 FAD-dependent oxidoreductase [Mycobacterium sp. 852002-51759_SCH5129042]